MCFSLPHKVVAIKNGNIIVSCARGHHQARVSLVKIKKGDYVLMQADLITDRITPSEAQKMKNTLKINYA